MPQRSKVYDLPPELRETLNERLVGSGFADYDGLSTWLAEQGFTVSRSSIQRYGADLQADFEAAMGDVRRTTEMAKALTANMDDDEGNLLDATVGIVQEQLLRILIALRKTEEEPAKAAKQMGSISRALADIGRVSLSQKKHAREIQREVLAQAAEVAESRLASQGMSQDAIDTIKRDILGIA